MSCGATRGRRPRAVASAKRYRDIIGLFLPTVKTADLAAANVRRNRFIAPTRWQLTLMEFHREAAQ
jgi:hypothetical protein